MKIVKRYFNFLNVTKQPTGPKGTGLGLAIVKEIAEQHHGKVLAEHSPIK